MKREKPSGFKKHRIHLLIFLVVLSIAFFLILYNIKNSMYNLEFYQKEFEKNGVYDALGRDFVNNATLNLFNYLQGNEELGDYFNEREKLHLADVKRLIVYGNTFYYALIAIIIILFYLKYAHSEREFLRNISKSFIASSLLVYSLFVVLVILKSRFHELFVKFHQIFFTNDLWILNPETDKLVVMFPERFFYDLSSMILAKTAISVGVLFIGGVLIYYLSKK